MTVSTQLVSIIIITYNSEKFILETLESAKSQTFQNLTLIVSDDHSSDNTVNICKKWLSENDSRFIKTALVTSNANTGISANCNRGVKVATGNWIKMIAGDDLLLPNCISDNIAFVEKHKEVRFVFSNMVKFGESENHKYFFEKYPSESHKIFFNTSAADQYYNLMTDNLACPAPASFLHRETLIQLGMFDERFPFIEDFPLWLSATSRNYTLYYFDKDTVLYRKGESLTQTPTHWRHKLFYKSAVDHFTLSLAKELRSQSRMYYFAKKAEFFKYDTLINFFQNKKNLFSKSFNFLFDSIFLNTMIKVSKRKRIPKSYFITTEQ